MQQRFGMIERVFVKGDDFIYQSCAFDDGGTVRRGEQSTRSPISASWTIK
jgi:hypothetical protein